MILNTPAILYYVLMQNSVLSTDKYKIKNWSILKDSEDGLCYLLLNIQQRRNSLM